MNIVFESLIFKSNVDNLYTYEKYLDSLVAPPSIVNISEGTSKLHLLLLGSSASDNFKEIVYPLIYINNSGMMFHEDSLILLKINLLKLLNMTSQHINEFNQMLKTFRIKGFYPEEEILFISNCIEFIYRNKWCQSQDYANFFLNTIYPNLNITQGSVDRKCYLLLNYYQVVLHYLAHKKNCLDKSIDLFTCLDESPQLSELEAKIMLELLHLQILYSYENKLTESFSIIIKNYCNFRAKASAQILITPVHDQHCNSYLYYADILQFSNLQTELSEYLNELKDFIESILLTKENVNASISELYNKVMLKLNFSNRSVTSDFSDTREETHVALSKLYSRDTKMLTITNFIRLFDFFQHLTGFLEKKTSQMSEVKMVLSKPEDIRLKLFYKASNILDTQLKYNYCPIPLINMYVVSSNSRLELFFNDLVCKALGDFNYSVNLSNDLTSNQIYVNTLVIKHKLKILMELVSKKTLFADNLKCSNFLNSSISSRDINILDSVKIFSESFIRYYMKIYSDSSLNLNQNDLFNKMVISIFYWNVLASHIKCETTNCINTYYSLIGINKLNKISESSPATWLRINKIVADAFYINKEFKNALELYLELDDCLSLFNATLCTLKLLSVGENFNEKSRSSSDIYYRKRNSFNISYDNAKEFLFRSLNKSLREKNLKVIKLSTILLENFDTFRKSVYELKALKVGL